MTELTPPSHDEKRAMLGAPPVVCARNCPFRVLCDAASGPRATTPVAVDLPSPTLPEFLKRRQVAHRQATTATAPISRAGQVLS